MLDADAEVNVDENSNNNVDASLAGQNVLQQQQQQQAAITAAVVEPDGQHASGGVGKDHGVSGLGVDDDVRRDGGGGSVKGQGERATATDVALEQDA